MVVSVPISEVMAEADTLMNSDGMLVFFAGVPNGTLAPLNLSAVYLDNAQYTGTSGLTIHDQQQVVDLADQGDLSPGSIVGAIGGMRAAKEGLQALVDGRYSGKVADLPPDPRPSPHGPQRTEGEAAGHRREAGARRHVEQRGGEGALRQPAERLAPTVAGWPPVRAPDPEGRRSQSCPKPQGRAQIMPECLATCPNVRFNRDIM